MLPDGFYIGPLKIYFYAILIILGAVAATWLASKEAKRRGLDPEMAWDLLPWALIGGILGARIWHILTPPQSMVAQGYTTLYYLTHPLDMFNIRNGGLGIPGGVLGGFIAVWIYTNRHKVSLGQWADSVAPGLALAQAVGRWGNFLNQEVYGRPTDLPWKLFIDSAHRLPGFLDVSYYHPLFLYESLWNLFNMGLLLFLSRKISDKLKTWDLFLVYLIVYPVGRFFLEFLRLDPSPIGKVDVNQMLMAVIAVAATALLVWRHRKTETSVE